MKRHYLGKVKIVILFTQPFIALTLYQALYQTNIYLPNKQQNFTNNKTLGLSKFKAFAENKIGAIQKFEVWLKSNSYI